MFRPLHRSRIIALASVTLAACHDAPDHELLERAAPLDDGADADADADGQEPGDPESGDPESDDAPIEDLIARQDPETQTLYVLDGFQDTVSDALGLIWVGDNWAVLPNDDLMLEVILLSLDDLISPEEQEAEGIKVWRNRKCVELLFPGAGPCYESDPDEPGRSYRYMKNEVNTCLRVGTSICVEYPCVHSEHHYFAGPNCTGAKLGVRELPGMTCDR